MHNAQGFFPKYFNTGYFKESIIGSVMLNAQLAQIADFKALS